MTDLPQSSHPSVTRSDTTSTDASAGSSGQSVPDIQQSPPLNRGPLAIPTGSDTTSSSQARPGTSSGNTGRKRKVPDSVTPNACTNCKKARAKCDGAKPACRRCNNRNVRDSCHYEIHAKTAKEQMIREIQRLQRKNEHLEEEKDTLGERNSWIEQIISSLRDDGQGGEIVTRLKRGESHKTIAEWLGRPLVGDRNVQTLSPTTEHSLSQAIQQYHKGLVDNHDPCYWTNVTQNAALIEHLVQLYLTWIHPVHMLFDAGHFMTSFRDCSDLYCSPSLVSIICAMSCHLLHNIDMDDEQTKAAVHSLRNRFMEETKDLMRLADSNKMTSIQTYGIMFLAELGSGNGLIASSHLRLATEMLVDKQNSEQSAESEQVSAWGVLTLHTVWSAFIYQKPAAPVSTRAHPFSSDILDFGDGDWRLYKQPGDSDTPERPGFSVMTASEHAKLFRIVHETILVYCGSRGKVTGRRLFGIYERYLTWKDNLPPGIRDVDNDPLPHVLFLHIQYHTAIVQLLQPLLHLDSIYHGEYVQIQSLIVQHAYAGLHLLVQYQKSYSNFYLSPLQLLCLVQICDAVVRYDGLCDTTPQTIHFCMASLEDSKGGYPFAGPLQKMFRLSLTEYNLPVPDEVERLIGTSARLGPDELLNACTRSTYRQPITLILPNVESGVAQDFVTGWQESTMQDGYGGGGTRGRAESGKGKRVEIGSMLNP